jgi:hypothetical protein
MAEDKKVKVVIEDAPGTATAWIYAGVVYAPGEQEIPESHAKALTTRGAIKGAKPTAEQKAFNDEFGDLAETFRGLGFDTRAKLKAADEAELRKIPGVDDEVIAKINK